MSESYQKIPHDAAFVTLQANLIHSIKEFLTTTKLSEVVKISALESLLAQTLATTNIGDEMPLEESIACFTKCAKFTYDLYSMKGIR